MLKKIINMLMIWLCKLVSGKKLKTMIYLMGKQGIGKSSVIKLFIKVLGLQTCVILNNEDCFTGQFNGPLLAKALVLLDEICHNFNDFNGLYNKIKPYITEDHISYRNLYEKLKTLKNLSSFIMSGNHPMLKLEDESKGTDRRLKVDDCDNVLKDAEYYEKLKLYTDNNEDVEYAMYWYCIDNHNKDFNELSELKKLPMTETKKQMVRQALITATIFLKIF